MSIDPVNKIVVMSDLHLGAEGCILNKEEENVQTLVGEIKDQKPEELILLGDVFDFSLCSLYETCSQAKEFFKELRKLDSLKVTYIPGNHDHHIWTYIIESEYFIKPLEADSLPDTMQRYIEKFVAHEPVKAPFLNKFHPDLEVVYPHVIRTCGDRKYYFTHGHLQDNIFTPGSDMRRPETLAELEAFNCWWVEGGWFYMGQAGRLGQKVRDIYEEKPWLGFVEAFSLGAKGFMAAILRALTGKASSWEKKEKSLTERAVTPAYIKDYIDLLIRDKVIEKKQLPITFVYGHTHEQKEETLNVSDHRCSTINTGTWIRKKEEDKKNNGFYVIHEKGNEWVPFWKK